MEDFKQRDGNPNHQLFKAANLAVEKKFAADGATLVIHPSLSKEGWSVLQSFLQNDMIDEDGSNPAINTFKNYVSGTTIAFAGPTLALYEPEGSASGEKLYVDPDLKQKIANDGSITQVKISCASLYAKLVATNGNAELILAMDPIATATPSAKVFFDAATITPLVGDTTAVVLFKTQDVSAQDTDNFDLNQGEKYVITGKPVYASASGVGTYTFFVKEIKA